MSIDPKAEVSEWISKLGLTELPMNWVISITLSTVPIEHLFYKRNKLKPESIKLRLSVPEYGLYRHDDLFQAQWRPNSDFRVQSQQLKYQRFVEWPRLHSLSEFPRLVADIEKCLSIRFLRHVDIGARLLDSEMLSRNKSIFEWLAPCADTIGHTMQS
ncbi:hypothetical protein F4U02_10920 [Acinetobacter haemolyticus]|uniref:hypothetical protein n=1 Tax=Acinetobacter haemolyticus TaxID=29430 RepID=UPI0012987999|nr:hypothetical protein [Acinetobacter haemolyticus]MQZ31496.1 hypothetical protein [Acinetobacter haemolyticus]